MLPQSAPRRSLSTSPLVIGLGEEAQTPISRHLSRSPTRDPATDAVVSLFGLDKVTIITQCEAGVRIGHGHAMGCGPMVHSRPRTAGTIVDEHDILADCWESGLHPHRPVCGKAWLAYQSWFKCRRRPSAGMRSARETKEEEAAHLKRSQRQQRRRNAAAQLPYEVLPLTWLLELQVDAAGWIRAAWGLHSLAITTKHGLLDLSKCRCEATLSAALAPRKTKIARARGRRWLCGKRHEVTSYPERPIRGSPPSHGIFVD